MQYGNSNGITVKMEGPFGSVGGTTVKLTQIQIPAASWKGATSPYSQVVEVDGISVNSRVDLLPDTEQVEMMRSHGIALMAGNDAGIVTIYAIGEKPVDDLFVAATILEVTA
jgi:hypothetical protein